MAKKESKIKSKETAKKTAADRKSLLAYLASEYGVSYFTKPFMYKIESVHNGSLQNLQTPVTYDVLLDMYKYYKQCLSEKAATNRKHGKSLNPQELLNYDLAVILAKHSEYIEMIERTKINDTVYENGTLPLDTVRIVENIAARQRDSAGNQNGDINIENMLDNW